MPQETVVVIDNGSDTLKAGLAGDDVPKVIFPTVVGKPIHKASRKILAKTHD